MCPSVLTRSLVSLALFTQECSEAVDRFWEASTAAALVVAEAKTQVCEEVRRPGGSGRAALSRGGEPLTLNLIIGWWFPFLERGTAGCSVSGVSITLLILPEAQACWVPERRLRTSDPEGLCPGPGPDLHPLLGYLRGHVSLFLIESL